MTGHLQLEEAWGWALVRLNDDQPQASRRAMAVLVSLAVRRHYAGGWYIKRINGLDPMTDTEFKPPMRLDFLVAVKAPTRDELVGALGEIVKELHGRGFSSVAAFEVNPDRRFEIDW